MHEAVYATDAERDTAPCFRLKEFYDYNAMLDTGALFPVWVEEENILNELGVTAINNQVEFGGFGGKAQGKLYKLPFVRVGELVFPELHIITCRMDLPCQMILSATMFRNLIYEIDDYHHRFNVMIPDTESEVRNVKIWDKNGRLHVAVASAP